MYGVYKTLCNTVAGHVTNTTVYLHIYTMTITSRVYVYIINIYCILRNYVNLTLFTVSIFDKRCLLLRGSCLTNVACS